MSNRLHVPAFAAMAAAILVVLALLWHGELRLRDLTMEHSSLLAHARALGITDRLAISTAEPFRTKSRIRSSRENIRRQGAGIIALVLDIQTASYQGRADDIQTRKLVNSLDASLMDLSPAQVVALLESLGETDEVEFEERLRLMEFALNMLAERHPDEFIEIAMRSDELIQPHIRTKALALWAERDIEAVIPWMIENETTRPDLVNEDTKRAVIYTVAGVSPPRAFELITGLSLERGWFAARSIVARATTAELRTASLHALRSHLASLQSSEARKITEREAYPAFGHSMRMQEFEASTKWIADAGLDEKEFALVLGNFGYNETRKNHGKWIEWMAGNLPYELLEGRIRNIVGGWTKTDFHAAGSWLAQAPDNAAKPLAVSAYVRTVAPFDPEIAEQWALTLTPNPERAELLKEIHRRWPQEWNAGKSAFAERHGIR